MRDRIFRVWLNQNIAGLKPTVTYISIPSESGGVPTDDRCELECREALDTLISNELDTGWEEIK